MQTRRRPILTVFAIGLGLALALSGPAMAIEGQASEHTGNLAGNEPLPTPYQPIPLPPPAPAAESEELQFVGVSSQLLAGNRGILNMTLACKSQFVGSRVCTAREVSMSLTVPSITSVGYAWVQSGESLSLGAGPDCRGWTSAVPDDTGITIELGPSSGCYGGFAAQGCDEQLVVACCARGGATTGSP